MPRMYMAVAQEDRHPITDIMRQTPDIPQNCQWAIFLRNHDELTLEMVTDRERDYLWRTFAVDRRMRINLGIRRRLAPLLDGDRRKIELLNSLLMSMPGTPILYYGDEIGMGDNVFLGDRNGVRTPMQWSPDRNGGFSRADPAALFLPPIMDAVYGYNTINVEAQIRNSSSLLNWTKRLIDVRQAHRAFGRGTLEFLYPGNRKVFAYLRRYENEHILCVANLSRAPQPVELNLSDFEGRVPIELIGRSPFPPIGKLPYFVTLPAYGFFWFLLAEKATVPSWHEPIVAPLPEILTLVTPDGFASLTNGAARDTLERRILTEYLPIQRWFAGKGMVLNAVELVWAVEINEDARSWLLAMFRAKLDGQHEHLYFIPFSVAWEEGAEDPLMGLLAHSLARVRKGSKRGVLYSAAADPTFAPALVRLMREGRQVVTATGERLVFSHASALEAVDLSQALEARRVGAEQSNSSLLLGEAVVLKILRRVHAGIHPELEVCRHLSEVAHFSNTPPLLGAIEAILEGGAPVALAVAYGFVRNQGDGWRYTLEYLQRFLEEAELRAPGEISTEEERHGAFKHQAHILGARTAELHRALAVPTTDAAFSPEPASKADLERWIRDIEDQGNNAHTIIQGALSRLPEDVAVHAGTLLRRWPELTARVRALVPERLEVAKTRCHGDYHLGQVLVVKDDFMIIDFEGEPERPMTERRGKHSPLRDVAGMLRSFSYAAWAAVTARAAARPRVREALIPWAGDWEHQTVEAFLDGYRSAIGDCPSYPSDPDTAQRLVTLFTIEKAFYEIAYEAANRPSWLTIPINGLVRLLGPDAR
jgi:maltose alpha-D-glucosyltransferase/alpha-amylase